MNPEKKRLRQLPHTYDTVIELPAFVLLAQFWDALAEKKDRQLDGLQQQIIRRKLKCQSTLNLIDLIIDHSNPQEEVIDYFPGDDLFALAERRKGLPMGNLTSQFFANLYLSSVEVNFSLKLNR